MNAVIIHATGFLAAQQPQSASGSGRVAREIQDVESTLLRFGRPGVSHTEFLQQAIVLEAMPPHDPHYYCRSQIRFVAEHGWQSGKQIAISSKGMITHAVTRLLILVLDRCSSEGTFITCVSKDFKFVSFRIWVPCNFVVLPNRWIFKTLALINKAGALNLNLYES